MTDIKSPLKNALCELKKLDIKITKETDNSYFKSKYADLATLLDAIEARAADFGILIISKIQRHDSGLELCTKLTHKDSEEIEESVFPIFGSKPQEIGSSVTYARRYNIQSLLNLAAEDDDGNAANEAKPIKTPVKPENQFWKTEKERTDLFNEIAKEIRECKDMDDLAANWLSRTEHLNALKKSEKQIFLNLEKQKNQRKTELGA
jgi:hypothetical protein